MRDFNIGPPASVYDIASQINILMNNSSWDCVVGFVFAVRNRVARFTSRLGMEVGDRLYIVEQPVGVMHELLDWDMGLGLDHPDYQDVILPLQAPDPVDFDAGIGLAEQEDGLGLGQENPPHGVVLDIEENEPQMGVAEVPEQDVQGGVNDQNNVNLFAGDLPLDDID